jgi:hypothetical protein
MHPDFPKLYAEISTDSASRDKRWAGVEVFASHYERPRIEMLARLLFATKPPAGGHQNDHLAAELTAFHKAFSDADPSIDQGARQDQILAAAVLIQYFAARPMVALAVTTTACGGARKVTLPVDLVMAAENALSLFAAEQRKRFDLDKTKIEAPELECALDFTGVQGQTPGTFQKVFDQLADAMKLALGDVVAKFNASTSLLADATKKADEELDMLSWVFGQRALLPDQPFAEILADQKPLVFARDLAALTTICPGPNSVRAFLARAGVHSSGKLKIIDAVNAVTDQWTADVLKNREPSPATSPIHFAIVKRQETGPGVAWHAGWAAITGIDLDTAMSPVTLAELFYREILWLR